MYSDLLLDPAPRRTSPATPSSTRPPDASTRLGPAADMTVANLRTAAGKDPHDKRLHELVGELSTRSDEFRNRWHAHDVRTHGAGVKRFHHHVVGDLDSRTRASTSAPNPD